VRARFMVKERLHARRQECGGMPLERNSGYEEHWAAEMLRVNGQSEVRWCGRCYVHRR